MVKFKGDIFSSPNRPGAILHRIRMSKTKTQQELFAMAAKLYMPHVDWKATFTEEAQKTPDIQLVLNTMKKVAPEVSAAGVKDFLIHDVGYDPTKVKHGIKVIDGEIIVRGSLKDTLDYEFYGNPKRTWPNVKRLRSWVLTAVIPTNPKLKKRYAEVRRDRPAREGMLQDLTFVIGRSIFENGLQKKSHWYYEKAEELRLAEESDDPKLMAKYKGIDIPRMSSRTGHGGVSKRYEL